MGPGSESQRDHQKIKTLYVLYGVFFITSFQGRGACPALLAGSPSGITTKFKETVQALCLSGFFMAWCQNLVSLHRY